MITKLKCFKLMRVGLQLGFLSLTACATNSPKAIESDDSKNTEQFVKSLGLSVSSVDEALLKAEKATQEDKLDLAQLYHVEAYQLEPNNVILLKRMADFYTLIKNYGLAELSLTLMIKLQPNNLEVLEQYGLLQLKQRKYEQAKSTLAQVIAKGQNWRSYNGLGIIADLQGDQQDAELYFNKADLLNPNSSELQNNLGFAYYSENKYKEAEAYYLKALAIEPDYKRALYNLALLQANLKNYDLAYSGFCKVSNNAEANNNVGYIAMLKGDYSIAKNYLLAAIQESPEFYKKANDNLSHLEKIVEK